MSSHRISLRFCGAVANSFCQMAQLLFARALPGLGSIVRARASCSRRQLSTALLGRPLTQPSASVSRSVPLIASTNTSRRLSEFASFFASKGDLASGVRSASSASPAPAKDEKPLSACGDIDDDEDDDDEDMEMMYVRTDSDILEWGGPLRGGRLPEPTRFGDWERKGRCTDF